LRRQRVLFFLIATVIGILAGVGYGWWLRPLMYTQANLSNLRVDYRTDYVLMTAEIYHQENNLEEARQRLQSLGANSPERYSREALLSAGQLGYSQNDLQLLANLVQALSPAAAETSTPTVAQP
jgi:hypothetical protein